MQKSSDEQQTPPVAIGEPRVGESSVQPEAISQMSIERVEGLTLSEWMERLASVFRDEYKTEKEHWSTLHSRDWVDAWRLAYTPEMAAREDADMWEE